MVRFAKWHPLVQFSFFICVLLLTGLSRHPVPVILSLFGAGTYLLLCDGARSWRSLLCVPVLVVLVGGFNFLFAHWGVTVLFSRGYTRFTLESLVYGCFQGGVFAGVVLWLSVFGRVLGSDRLLAVTGRAAPRFSLLFSMTLGCIARFRQNARQIRLARAGAGVAHKKPLQEALAQFSTLVTLSLEGSMTTADAMRARGYGKGYRRVYDPFTFRASDGVLLAMILILGGAVLAVSLTGGMTFYFDPVLKWVSLSPFGAVAAGVLCFCPVILDAGEWLQWRCLKRKN